MSFKVSYTHSPKEHRGRWWSKVSQADSLQVMLVIKPAVGCYCFLPAIMFPASEHLHSWLVPVYTDWWSTRVVDSAILFARWHQCAQVNHIRHMTPMCPHKRAHWRHMANTTELSTCGGDAALCQITLTTCYYYGEDGGGGHWLVRMEWRPARWSVCLPLLIFSCTIKSRSSHLAPAHPGGPGKRAVKRL